MSRLIPSLYGISEKVAKDAATFDNIYNELAERITNQITVHHMPFDRNAISRACVEYNLDVLEPITCPPIIVP